MTTTARGREPAREVPVGSATVVADLELSTAATGIPPRGPAWGLVRVLVRAHGVPLGEVVLPLPEGGLTGGALVAAALDRFAAELALHCAGDGITCPLVTSAETGQAEAEPVLPPARPTSPCGWRAQWQGPELPVTAVVTTIGDRPELSTCLDALLAQTYRPVEVLVVDNSRAGSDRVRRLCGDSTGEIPVSYVHEPRAGLSHARNAGLAVARGVAIAFTDDDVVVDTDWLGWLVVGLRAGDTVAASTGLILPTDLETRAQQLFEEFGGYSKGFRREVLDGAPDPDDPLHPYRVGRYGSGASSAWWTARLTSLGGFDARLGAGTPSAGGEDLDIFLRVVLAGRAIVYEPRALLRHPNHRSEQAFRRQVHGYGRGLGAVLAKHVVEGSWEQRLAMLRRLRAGAVHLLASGSRKNQGRSTGYPARLTALELAGVLRGAGSFIRTRRTPRGR